MSGELERPEPAIEGKVVEPGDVAPIQEIVWAFNQLAEALRETMTSILDISAGWNWYEPHKPGKPHRYSGKSELLARVQDHWKDTQL